jgi:hypothetical protein
MSVDFSKDPITLVVEEVSEVVKSEATISEATISEATISEVVKSDPVISEIEQSKSILINVSKLIMDITASDDFNINLDSSKQVADMIQKLLNL